MPNGSSPCRGPAALGRFRDPVDVVLLRAQSRATTGFAAHSDGDFDGTRRSGLLSGFVHHHPTPPALALPVVGLYVANSEGP